MGVESIEFHFPEIISKLALVWIEWLLWLWIPDFKSSLAHGKCLRVGENILHSLTDYKLYILTQIIQFLLSSRQFFTHLYNENNNNGVSIYVS